MLKSIRRFSASSSPCSVPPRSTSMNGKACRVDDVAGRNHVAAAEEHDGVAVGVRGGLVDDLNALAVQVHRVLAIAKVFVGQSASGKSAAARRRGHPRQHVLVREHAGGAGVGEQVVASPAPAATAPGRMLRPAFESFSLPPTWSASMLVLMM